MGCSPVVRQLSASDELSEFVYCVTHDLRSPLVNIRALTGELRHMLEPTSQATAAEANPGSPSNADVQIRSDISETLGHLDSCVSRMDRVISQLVRYSRLGHGELTFSEVDLATLVSGIVQRTDEALQETSGEIEVESLPRLWADPIAMEQVFTELLHNALKFTVTGRPARISVTCQSGGDFHLIRVSDNGRGIAEKDLGRIFAPLRRAGKIDTSGDGMGLAIVRALVHRQGGAIACASTLDEGTCFTLRFPTGAGGVN